MADRHDIIIRVVPTAVIGIQRGTGKGIRWSLPSPPTVSGRRARFQGQAGLGWSYHTITSGVKLLSDPVAEQLGFKTYSFSYQLLGNANPFSLDDEGNLVSDAFTVPRAFAIGADGRDYAAGPWRVEDGQASFDFDDALLPAEAFPYELDPSTYWIVGASGDDNRVLRYGSTYPPAGGTLLWPAGSRVEAARERTTGCGGGSNGPYCIRNGFIRWNTSSLPNAATINSAQIKVQFTYLSNVDNRVLTADWYNTGWPIDAADYSASYQIGASSGWTIPASYGVYFFDLANVSNVSKTSYTGIRMHMSGGVPTGNNRVSLISFDDTDPTAVAPRLIVVYDNIAPTPTVISPTEDGWTDSKVLDWSYYDGNGDDQSKFEVEVDDDADFSSPVESTGQVSGSATTWDVAAGLSSGARYYWRVRAFDGFEWGAWSPAGTFRWDETPPTSALSAPANEASVGGVVTIEAVVTEAQSGVDEGSFFVTQLGKKTLVGTDVDGSDGWSVSMDTRSLSDGLAVLSAEFTDNVGHVQLDRTGGVAVLIANATPAPERWAATASAEGVAPGDSDARVVLGTGQLVIGAGDTVIPGRGFNASFDRGYNSGSATAGIMGPGWRASIEDVLVPSYDGSVLHIDGAGRQDAFSPVTASGGLAASYWNNTTLSGTPAVTRTDAVVDFNWGTGSPGIGVNADGFSARWSGYVSVPTAGSWTFYSSTDDGGRVQVDGVYVTDDWRDHGPTETSGAISLGAGLHEITMEYYENAGGAAATLSWSGPGVAKQVIPSTNLLQRTGFTAPAGIYEALAQSTDGTFTLKDKDQVVADFTAAGLRDTVTDPNGNTLRVAYDTNARPQYICVSPAACSDATAQIVLSVDPATGRLVSVSDQYVSPGQYERTWSYDYDPSGRLSSVTDPLGDAVTYGYDGTGRLSSVTDAESDQGRITYASGKVTAIQDPRSVAAGGQSTTFAYSSSTTTVTSPGANAQTPVGTGTVYGLGAAGQLLNATDPLGNTSSATWDTNFNTLSSTDELGKTTTRSFDARGNMLSETDPLGHATTYTYDTNNNLLTETDALNHTTTYTYDARGNQLSVTDPLGKKSTSTYDAYGQKVSEVEPRGNEPGANASAYTSTHTYDSSGNLTSRTDPLGNVTSFGYDAAGNRTSETEPLHPVASTAYDKLGNVLSETDAAGNKTTYTYDRAGRPKTEVGPVGNVAGNNPADYTTTTAYFADGLERSSTDPLGNATTYGYDANGNRTTVTDPRGKVTTSVYDAGDRLIQSTDPGGGITTYVYDATGRTLSVTGPALVEDPGTGQMVRGTTSYSYDAAGQLLTTTDPKGNITTNSYDDAGQLLSTIDPLGHSSSNAYDAAGQLTAVTTPVGATSYAHDAAGNQTSVTDPTGAVATFTYDTLGRESTRTSAASATQTATGSVDAFGTTTSNTALTTSTAGSISAALSWGAAPPLATGTQTNSLAPSQTRSYTISAEGAALLEPSLTWTQGQTTASNAASGSFFSAPSSLDYPVEVTSTHTAITGSLDWVTYSKNSSSSGSVAAVGTDSRSITAEGPGPIVASITWQNATSSALTSQTICGLPYMARAIRA